MPILSTPKHAKPFVASPHEAQHLADIETLIDTRTTIPGNDQYDFGAYAGQLSPDGSALAYIYLSHYTENESSSLRLRELLGGEFTLIPSTLYQQMAYRPGLVDFSPSGNFLLIQVFNDPPPPSICVASAPDWRPSRIADGFPIGFEELGSWRPAIVN